MLGETVETFHKSPISPKDARRGRVATYSVFYPPMTLRQNIDRKITTRFIASTREAGEARTTEHTCVIYYHLNPGLSNNKIYQDPSSLFILSIFNHIC